MHINAVVEWAGELFGIIAKLNRGTGTLVVGIAGVATGAGVHGGDKHKVGRIGGFAAGTRNGDLLIFKGLTESFKDISMIFGEFIKKEDAGVSKRDFTRECFGATADNGDGAGGVVRSTKGALSDNCFGVADKGVEFGSGDLFSTGEWWEEIASSAGEHGFASAGWAAEKDVVSAGDGDSEGAFGEGLAANMVKNGARNLCLCIFYNTICGKIWEDFLAFEMQKKIKEGIDADELDIINE